MTTVTSKGQVTIPKRIRDHLGLKPGSEVAFEPGPNGQIVLKPAASSRKKSPVARLRGSRKLRYTTDELMAMTRGE